MEGSIEDLKHILYEEWGFIPYEFQTKQTVIKNIISDYVKVKCKNCNTEFRETYKKLTKMKEQKRHYCPACQVGTAPKNIEEVPPEIESDKKYNHIYANEGVFLSDVKSLLGYVPYEVKGKHVGQYYSLNCVRCGTNFNARPHQIFEGREFIDAYDTTKKIKFGYCPNCEPYFVNKNRNLGGERFIEKVVNLYREFGKQCPYRFDEELVYRFRSFDVPFVVKCAYCEEEFTEIPNNIVDNAYNDKGKSSLCPNCHGHPQETEALDDKISEIKPKSIYELAKENEINNPTDKLEIVARVESENSVKGTFPEGDSVSDDARESNEGTVIYAENSEEIIINDEDVDDEDDNYIDPNSEEDIENSDTDEYHEEIVSAIEDNEQDYDLSYTEIIDSLTNKSGFTVEQEVQQESQIDIITMQEKIKSIKIKPVQHLTKVKVKPVVLVKPEVTIKSKEVANMSQKIQMPNVGGEIPVSENVQANVNRSTTNAQNVNAQTTQKTANPGKKVITKLDWSLISNIQEQKNMFLQTTPFGVFLDRLAKEYGAAKINIEFDSFRGEYTILLGNAKIRYIPSSSSANVLEARSLVLNPNMQIHYTQLWGFVMNTVNGGQDGKVKIPVVVFEDDFAAKPYGIGSKVGKAAFGDQKIPVVGLSAYINLSYPLDTQTDPSVKPTLTSFINQHSPNNVLVQHQHILGFAVNKMSVEPINGQQNAGNMGGGLFGGGMGMGGMNPMMGGGMGMMNPMMQQPMMGGMMGGMNPMMGQQPMMGGYGQQYGNPYGQQQAAAANAANKTATKGAKTPEAAKPQAPQQPGYGANPYGGYGAMGGYGMNPMGGGMGMNPMMGQQPMMGGMGMGGMNPMMGGYGMFGGGMGMFGAQQNAQQILFAVKYSILDHEYTKQPYVLITEFVEVGYMTLKSALAVIINYFAQRQLYAIQFNFDFSYLDQELVSDMMKFCSPQLVPQDAVIYCKRGQDGIKKFHKKFLSIPSLKHYHPEIAEELKLPKEIKTQEDKKIWLDFLIKAGYSPCTTVGWVEAWANPQAAMQEIMLAYQEIMKAQQPANNQNNTNGNNNTNQNTNNGGLFGNNGNIGGGMFGGGMNMMGGMMGGMNPMMGGGMGMMNPMMQQPMMGGYGMQPMMGQQPMMGGMAYGQPANPGTDIPF